MSSAQASYIVTEIISYCIFFLCVQLCRFCLVICLFIPATTAKDLRLLRISIPNVTVTFFCSILILEKEPVFLFKC